MLSSSKFTFMRLLGRFCHLFFKAFDSWKTFLAYAVIITLFSAVFSRWTYSCQGSQIGFWCNNVPNNTVIGLLLSIAYYTVTCYLLLSFLYDFYNVTFKNTVFKLSEIFKINREKWFSILMFIFILFSITLPFVGAWLIVRKPANPDWRIEFIWYTLTFICAMLPILQIRLSSAVAYFLENYKVPSVKTLMQKTFGRAYVPLVCFIILLLLISVINLRFYADLNHYAVKYNNVMGALFTEFGGKLLSLILLSIFIIYVRAQYELLDFEIEESSKSTSIPSGEPQAKKIEKKPAKAKNSTKGKKHLKAKKK